MSKDEKKQNVQWYDHRTQEMANSQKYKIQKLLERDCIRQLEDDTFLCLPIPGYNTRTYSIKKEYFSYSCNCQHYRMKKTDCSHIGAVREYLAMGGGDGQLELFPQGRAVANG